MLIALRLVIVITQGSQNDCKRRDYSEKCKTCDLLKSENNSIHHSM